MIGLARFIIVIIASSSFDRMKVPLNETKEVRTTMGSEIETEDQIREKILQEVNRLPYLLRSSVDQVSLRAPQLLQIESDPLWFLLVGQDKTSGYHDAATKLSMYWSKRIAVFGQRALSNNTRDLLSQEDISSLKDSGLHILQLSPTPTLFFDVSKMTTNVQHASELRGLMYCLQMVVRPSMKTATPGGIGFLLYVPGDHLISMAEIERFILLLGELVQHSLPLTLLRLHIVSDTCKSSRKTELVSLLNVATVKGIGDECVLTIGDSPDSLCSKLTSFGFKRERLPTSLGGSNSLSELVSRVGLLDGDANATAHIEDSKDLITSRKRQPNQSEEKESERAKAELAFKRKRNGKSRIADSRKQGVRQA